MTFRKLIIILSVTVVAILLVLLGTSYAWYTFTNASTPFNNVQTSNYDTDLAVVFSNTDNINTVVGIPIRESDAEELADKTLFSITPKAENLSGKEVAYEISVVNLNVASELKATDSLKYSLIEIVGEEKRTVATGNFKNASDSISIMPMTQMSDFNKTYSYEFRIWLEETDANQNSLMGKALSGKIKVSTIIR